MSIPQHPPMELGNVLDGLDDAGNLANESMLGSIYHFPTFTSSANQRGNKARPGGGRMITAVLLRNTSGLTLLGKRLGLLDTTAGYGGCKNVVGYASARAERKVVLIDPWLPSTGVADDECFWGIIAGPAIVLTPIAGSGFGGADIAVGGPLIATTGTTTGVTTSGRVGNPAIANATDAQGAFDQAIALLGRALSARTTGETASDLLVDWNIQTFR